MNMETKLHENLVAQRANGSMLERLGASVSKALLALMLVVAYAVPAQATTRITYIHNDHLGTPQVMTDESGAVVWRADYRPFGEADVTVNSLGNDLRFPGQIYDEETGLHYNYFRDYDPGTGRYVQSDPIGLLGGTNTFVYADGNPTMEIDPYGLFRVYPSRRQTGHGVEYRYWITFQPVGTSIVETLIKKIPGMRAVQRGVDIFNNIVNPHIGPLNPVAKGFQCEVLDSDLQKDFVERYGRTGCVGGTCQDFTAEELEDLLGSWSREYPQFEELYGTPEEIIQRANSEFEDSWRNDLGR